MNVGGIELSAKNRGVLKKQVKHLGLSVSEAARRVGIAQPTLYNILKGDRNPRRETLKTLCRVLECEVAFTVVEIRPRK